METEPENSPRPYWHVDAKWITGLILTVILGLTLLLFNLVQITAEEPAVDALTTTLAVAFSREGLEEEGNIEEFRRRLRASPDGRLQPIPGLRITVEEEDVADLSPRETRLFIFRQMAEPLYRDGAEGLMALAEDPEMRESIADGVGPLMVFTQEAHQILRRALLILGLLAAGLLLPLIYFSHRFGRLGSPGCVLFAASLPGALLFTAANQVLRDTLTPQAPDESAGLVGMAQYAAANVLPPLVQTISRNFRTTLLLGLGMIAVAVVGHVAWWVKSKRGET